MILDDGTNNVIISNPVYGYKSIISLPFTVQELEQGYDIYDEGADYDMRQCECSFQLPASKQSDLLEILNGTGRGLNTITMTLPSDSGYHPFGPDKSDNGVFTISAELLKTLGLGNMPYKYFITRVRFTNEGTFPAYSYPSESDEGGLTIGTITGLRFPDEWFRPSLLNSVSGSPGYDGSLSFVDRGALGDNYNTNVEMICNSSKASRLINYLIGTSRATNFTMTTDTDYYAFGYSKGSSASYIVKTIQDKIVITHENYNRFKFNLAFNYVATLD